MELTAVMRTTGAVRAFTDEAMPDETLYRLLEVARFAPSGGNRQGWRVVVVRDPDTRERLRDLYLDGWYEYLAMGAAGLVPWAPVTDRAAERAALRQAGEFRRQAEASGGGFAEHLHRAPVLLVVLADLAALAAVDRDGPRYPFAGGASIYPFAHNLLLAANDEGWGGVMTTMLVRREDEVRRLLGAPDHVVVAAMVVLGRPARPTRRLTRRAVEAFTTVDRVDGAPFGPAP